MPKTTPGGKIKQFETQKFLDEPEIKRKTRPLTDDERLFQNSFIEQYIYWDSMRSEKDASVRNARSLYELPMEARKLGRTQSYPSYFIHDLVELCATLMRWPAHRLFGAGIDPSVAIVMNKYLEKVLRDSGVIDLFETGWSVYREMALVGDVFIVCGYNKKGMPVYRMKKATDFSFPRPTTRIRSRAGGYDTVRYGYIQTYTIEEADRNWPGLLDYAVRGSLPLALEPEDEAMEKTNQQMTDLTYRFIQIMFCYDKFNKLEGMLCGANAFPWNLKKEYPFVMQYDGGSGVDKEVLNLAHFRFLPKPRGLFGCGLGEFFYNIAWNIFKMQSAQLNNTTDNYNAPPILPLDAQSYATLMTQIERAEQIREDLGRSSALQFDPATSGGAQVNANTIGYLRNDFPAKETEAIIAKFETEARRIGLNLDYQFTDAQKTATQSEYDIRSTNQTISKIQGDNEPSYRFIVQFAIDAIIQNGNGNDKTPFGNDIPVDMGDGQSATVGQIMKKKGRNSPLTIGEIVKDFKKFKNRIQFDVDTRNGVRFNDLLVSHNLMRQLQYLPQGSPEQLKVYNQFSELFGGEPASLQGITPPPQLQQQQPGGQQAPQPLPPPGLNAGVAGRQLSMAGLPM